MEQKDTKCYSMITHNTWSKTNGSQAHSIFSEAQLKQKINKKGRKIELTSIRYLENSPKVSKY